MIVKHNNMYPIAILFQLWLKGLNGFLVNFLVLTIYQLLFLEIIIITKLTFKLFLNLLSRSKIQKEMEIIFK